MSVSTRYIQCYADLLEPCFIHVVISWVGLTPNVCVSVFQVKIDAKPVLCLDSH